jgi:hypothetical protein
MVNHHQIHFQPLETTANIKVTVANAVGPWVASYNTYTTGTVTAKADTPIWILVTAGLLLGLGFWCMFHISRR